MKAVDTPEEFEQSLEDWDYLCSTPVGRFFINYWRKKFGEPPLRLAEVWERERKRPALK